MSPVQVWFLALFSKPLVANAFRDFLFLLEPNFSNFSWCKDTVRKCKVRHFWTRLDKLLETHLSIQNYLYKTSKPFMSSPENDAHLPVCSTIFQIPATLRSIRKLPFEPYNQPNQGSAIANLLFYFACTVVQVI